MIPPPLFHKSHARSLDSRQCDRCLVVKGEIASALPCVYSEREGAAKPEAGPMRDAESPSGVQALGSSSPVCCSPAPDRTGRTCDLPRGHEGDHWTYGMAALSW